MCFFREIILSCCFILFSYLLYYLWVIKGSRKENQFGYCLFLLVGVLFSFLFPSMIRYFFLDLFIFLAYREKLYKQAILLSAMAICYGLYFLEIPLSFIFLSTSLYFVLWLFFHSSKRHLEISFLFMKGFLSSIILFYGTPFSVSSTLELILMLVLFGCFFLNLSPIVIEGDDLEEMMGDLEKNLFKITHEIKNPIAVCKGYLDMIDLHDSFKLEKYFPIIKNEINRTLVIMDDFMSIRSLSIDSDIMDFYLLLEDIESTSYFLLKNHGCMLKIPATDEELYIYADYDRLKQVFINLIKNSLEAGATSIVIDVKTTNSNLSVRVKDNGEGMSQDNLDHLGELFFTTKRTGTGVGVHFSTEIIKLHHGKIIYQSKIGKGTCAKITLPLDKTK